MIKKIRIITVILLVFLSSIGWAAGSELELIAPGGGEMDMEKNLVKYYSAGSQPVEARWENSKLFANYLEYYRDQELIKAKDKVKLVEIAPGKRVLNCGELNLEVKRDFLVARNQVLLQMDADSSATGGVLEWDRVGDKMKFSEKPVIHSKEWRINSELIEGQPNKGIYTLSGPINATDGEAVAKAGKAIYNQNTGQIFFQDNPVFTRGKNEMKATEIIYELNTKKVSAKGLVTSKIIKE